MQNMAFSVLPNVGGSALFVIVISASAPSTTEWTAYIRALQKLPQLDDLKTLVITEGGGPDSVQRRLVIDLMKGKPTLTCMVSNNPVVRGLTVALSWFNPGIRSFPLDRIDDGLRHLQLAPMWHDQVWKDIRRLRADVGATPIAPAARV